MKKRFLFIIATFFLLGIFLNNPINSRAAEVSSQIVTKQEAHHKAMMYLKSVSEKIYPKWKNTVFSESKTLHDVDGEIKGYLFQVQKDNQDYGYIIVNGVKGKSSIIESTREGGNPYKDVPEGQALYTGPLQYLKIEKDKIIDITTDQTMNRENIKSVDRKQMRLAPLKSSFTSGTNISSDVYNSKLLDSVPDYTWFIGCTPTAFANIVTYWSKNGFPNLFRSNEYAIDLVDNLATLMETDRGTGETTNGILYGTWPRKIAPALQKYWNERGYNAEIYWDYQEKMSFDKMKKELDAGRPFGLGIEGHPIYESHAITGIGYEEIFFADINEKYRNIVIRDTWSSTPAEVILNYDELYESLNHYTTVNPYVFLDVPKTHWAYEQIMYMAGNKIMSGYGNGYFGAQDNITREQLAAFLYRYLKPRDTNENPYKDIGDNPFKKEILALTKSGIFSVNTEKKFNPKNTATRAEIAAVLTKAFNLKIKANYEFNDMKGHWANEYVKALYSNGIASGTGNKNFSPGANVTREQMAVFLYRAINLDSSFVPPAI
ncbi:S-layer homology domain-containing protein [Bacillus sp. FSL M8-0063]|uniref:S-layer homology domain-containing protein n=1 Tax=Bacillus sp. FSL M8-0063 TaxID=2921566 RepID=UPI0030FCD70C